METRPDPVFLKQYRRLINLIAMALRADSSGAWADNRMRKYLRRRPLSAAVVDAIWREAERKAYGEWSDYVYGECDTLDLEAEQTHAEQ